MEEYPISILEHRLVEKVELDDKHKIIHVKGGEKFITGSLYNRNRCKLEKAECSGESDHIGKGVAFEIHCDSPFYKDKHVAVIAVEIQELKQQLIWQLYVQK